MSQWTHITGTLRVDTVLGDPNFHNFKRIFIESTWGNRNENCNMPMGEKEFLPLLHFLKSHEDELKAFVERYKGGVE